jgi:glycerol-3-phosphate dehydrogenase
MRFVLPHSPEDRPAWLVRIGLLLYDHLGGRKLLPPARTLDLSRDPEGAPIKDAYEKAFEYSDCWVDDARLVALNAIDAKARGAEILTRVACVSARVENGRWRAELGDQRNGRKRLIEARAIVNASGPWVNDVIRRVLGANSRRSVRLVKGSHIITRKFWDGPQAYLVQNFDKRVIFINPYEGDKALIGTTDIPFSGRAEDVEADESEIAYLIAAVNRYFKRELKREDVLETFSGVRPLFDDGKGNPSAVTRDYVFDLDDARGAPALNVFGGKITTFRKLAEHALDRLKTYFPAMGPAWTAHASLPGGEIANADFDTFRADFKAKHSWMPDSLATHFGRLYGTRAEQVIGAAASLADLGRAFGPDFYEAEARYLWAEEWAETAEDILSRRTKHGLGMSEAERAAFAQWMASTLAH